MPELSLKQLTSQHVNAGRWATSVLACLAREEQLERRPRRLLEPGHATWKRFRGRLDWGDWFSLLAQDAAVVHPIPFDTHNVLSAADARRVAEITHYGRWIQALDEAPEDDATYVREQARRLGCPTQFARSNLHQLKPHHRVLELPGTGGQLAHHVATTQPDIFIQDVFTVATADWRELALAGFIAVELRAPTTDFIVRDADLSTIEGPFDYVFGVEPEKGGAWSKGRLEELFAPATVVLV